MTDYDGKVILAVDAGVSTGAVLGEVRDGDIEVLCVNQFICNTFTDTVDRLMSMVYANNVDTVVTERFDLRPGNKFTADLTTVQVNAALQYTLQSELIVEWVEQTPAQAKTLVTDAALKRLGWWVTGKQFDYKDANDARDALRHLARYGVVELRLQELANAGWGEEDEQ